MPRIRQTPILNRRVEEASPSGANHFVEIHAETQADHRDLQQESSDPCRSFSERMSKYQPEARPTARAAGGDRKPLAARSRPSTKTILEIIWEGAGDGGHPPAPRVELTGNALSEGPDRFLSESEYFENREQLGHLKQISNTLGQIAELDGAPAL